MPDIGAVHVNGPLQARKGRNRLRKVRVDFISLVDRPDCPTATVQILKRDPRSTTRNLSRRAASTTDGFVATNPGGEPMSKGTEPGALTMDGLPEPIVKYILALEDEVLKAQGDTLVDDDIDDETDEGDLDDEYEDDDADLGDDDLDLDDLTEDELAELVAELEGEGLEDEAALTKLAKFAPAIAGPIVKMQERLAKAEAQAAQDRLARRVVEFRKRAGEMDELPIATSDLAEILLKAEDALGPRDYQVLEGLLRKTATELRESGLFTEMGVAGAETAGSKIDELAKRAMQVASGDVSAEKALLKMLELDPTAYDEQERAKMGGRR